MAYKGAHYTVRIADQVCKNIALGMSLDQALKKVGYLAPSIELVWKWIDTIPEFRDKYDRARQFQADSLADRHLELAVEVLQKPNAASAYRVAGDILRWHSEIRKPKVYGSKATEGDKTPLDPAKIKSEIKRLEEHLGLAERQGKSPAKFKVVSIGKSKPNLKE